MSQVLPSGVSSAGSAPHKVTGMGKSVVGQGAKTSNPTNPAHQVSQPLGQPQTQSNINMMSNPTPGMPGVLPGSILTGHTQKGVSMVTPASAMSTPIMGSGTMNGSSMQQQAGSMLPSSGQISQAPSTSGAAAGNQGDIILSNNTHTLANTKEKTPMCLINELARFNKIQHQYTLTDEQGPAHKKIFYVKLKLGDEEYAANGPSIKKAQHAAAQLALECSQYKHPPPKPPRNNPMGSVAQEITYSSANPSITPTVELNALAMKLGQPAIYRPLEPARNAYYPPNLNFRGMYNQRYHQPRGYARIFYVSLKVGQREFIGEGNTRQTARHNAAQKALKVLSVLPITQDEMLKSPTEQEDLAPVTSEETPENTSKEDLEDEDPLKSEISLVHEIALKRNLHVDFEVIRESGPPHMKTFITRCTCGNHKTDGEGNSKKLSKKRAAEKMLEELQQLPVVNVSVNKTKKTQNKKKNSRNLIKKADPDYGVGINPISRLIQIQQAKKEKEPVYTLVAEKGMPRRKEFVMQVSVGDQNCNGVGPNKKLAKRNAAEAMLQLLGYSRPSPQPAKPAIKSADNVTSPSADKKVTFQDSEHSQPCVSRQLIPGVLYMPDPPRHGQAFAHPQGGVIRAAPGGANAYQPTGGDMMGVKFSPQTTAAVAKELLDTEVSPTAEAINKARAKNITTPSMVRPKQKLLYLAEVLGLQVQFTDFPKSGKKSEYLSLVSLSTNPTQVSHGSGPTIDASHDIAALTALRSLSDMGLDMAEPQKTADNLAGGDGLHLNRDKQDGTMDKNEPK